VPGARRAPGKQKHQAAQYAKQHIIAKWVNHFRYYGILFELENRTCNLIKNAKYLIGTVLAALSMWKKKHIKKAQIFVICIFFAMVLSVRLQAVTLYPKFSKGGDSVVTATVGQFHISITGYQSPYASIILKTQNGTFLASTTADAKGYFSITDILINSSTLQYCFQAVDFKRIGESDSCITVSGTINKDLAYTDIFLPPTIGLSKKQINAGQDGIIFGYTMPGATVYLDIEGKVIIVTADETGYYTYTYKKVPEGVFRISASAEFTGKKSLAPTNDVILEAVSVPHQITETGEKIVKKIGEKVPFELVSFLLVGIFFLVAIGILLYKLRFKMWVIFIDFLRRRKKMHHDWFLDKW
jgi:hypothetical protein